jgi:CheY-like chemotaxis protein
MNKLKFVMLVDDNDIDILIGKRLIQMLDMSDDVKSYQNGRQAIEAFKILNQLKICPDLILLDLNMPVLDGFGFMKEYQKLPEDMKKGKVIILTSSSDPNDIRKAKELGCHNYLVKPLTFEKLNSATGIFPSVKKVAL